MPLESLLTVCCPGGVCAAAPWLLCHVVLGRQVRHLLTMWLLVWLIPFMSWIGWHGEGKSQGLQC